MWLLASHCFHHMYRVKVVWLYGYRLVIVSTIRIGSKLFGYVALTSHCFRNTYRVKTLNTTTCHRYMS